MTGLGALREPDENGIRLPAGFTSRVLARSGERVGPQDYMWHGLPDGGATFALPDGGWVYTSNSENLVFGGAGAMRFDRDGQLVDAYPILEETSRNCAGGPSPWGTWFSCEERDRGVVWECDPLGVAAPIQHDTLGHFKHEAIAFDTTHGIAYLTEDEGNGGLYRFLPSTPPPRQGRWDLSAGTLEVAEVLSESREGSVVWHPVPNPTPSDAEVDTRAQVAEMSSFAGGEGIWFVDDTIYFSTKGSDRIWALDTVAQEMRVLYDFWADLQQPLRGVDNIVATTGGEVVVAEDGGNMEINVVSAEGAVSTLLRVEGQDDSEIAGPAFDPSGQRLYFSSQRGTDGAGITYEIRGPFFV